MNRSRIEWCDHTLNIVTGCRHGCEYCYAKQMVRRFSGNIKKHKTEIEKFRMESGGYVLDQPFLDETQGQVHYPFGFEPTYHRYRFDILDKLKMGQNIFVGAMGDLFGDFIPEHWIQDVFTECEIHPKNNYIFLTKNPERYGKIRLMDGNSIYGTSITKEDEIERIGFLPKDKKCFVSFEPLLEDVFPEEHTELIKNLDWIIIGAETGHRQGKVFPEESWIKKIVDAADKFNIPVFMKDSLVPIVGEKNMRTDLPEVLKRREMSEKVKGRLVSNCAACGKEFWKNQMVTITVRKKRGGKQKSLCHICDECLEKFCEKYNLQTPNLDD